MQISHNEKLKTLGDNENTNLYVANLPLAYNEAVCIRHVSHPQILLTLPETLKAIFINYDCISSKILRDQNGLSRGVGFARYGIQIMIIGSIKLATCLLLQKLCNSRNL